MILLDRPPAKSGKSGLRERLSLIYMDKVSSYMDYEGDTLILR